MKYFLRNYSISGIEIIQNSFALMIRLKIFISIFCLVFVACSPVKKYENASVKWKDDIHTFQKLDSTETYSSDAILFAGSSSIRLWKNIAADMKPYNIIQRGYGGSTLADLAIYTKQIILSHKPQAIVIFAANDITGSPDDKKPEEMPRIFKHIVKQVRINQPETPIFYIQVTPTGLRWKSWSEIQKGNVLIQQLCPKLHKVYFIETASAFLNSKSEPRDELFVADRLHLNQSGYDLWAMLIKKKLDEVLKK